MSYILDVFEISPVEGSHPLSVEIGIVGKKFGRSVMVVHEATLLLANSALQKADSSDFPISIKFGNFWRGMKFNFRGLEGKYYMRSVVLWRFPLGIRWQPGICVDKNHLQNLLAYYAKST